MEMEDDHTHPHHLHLHHQQQQQEYGVPDLYRQTLFPGIPQAAATAELFPGHHHHHHGNLTPQQGHSRHHYEMLMMPRGLQDFNNSSAAAAAAAATNANNSTSTTSVAVTAGGVSTPSFSGFECEAASFGGEGGNGRWPRQETLTLLEIRSRLDSKFKEANQKGPLWDEVSRIMSEEHGYQRSGKKCREKFENLYKYYKKTKEGKAGRQDGKHYRFFRQLEALYGDNSTSNSVSVQETHLLGSSSSLRFNHSTSCNNTTPNQATHYQDLVTFPSSSHNHNHKLCDSLSLSNNSSEFNSLSSDDDDDDDNNNDLSTMENNDSTTEKRRNNKKRGGRRSWKAKIKEFIDSQMRKLIDRQEAWMEKLTNTLEQKEQERVLREEEWRRQEQSRIDKEHKFWSKERAWIEARDASLMKTLQNLTGKQLKDDQSPSEEELMIISNNNGWTDYEITRLIKLRTSLEARFDQQSGNDSEEVLWEEIARKMICLGYEKNGLMCKVKWDEISRYLNKTNKKRKEEKNNNSRSSCEFFQSSEGSLYNTSHQRTAYEASARLQLNDSTSPAGAAASNSTNNNVVNAVSDSCFRFLMADGDHLWENYGLKLSNGENQ